jgi:hypothetical protein
MENTNTLNHNFATIADGALLIWWGIVIMVDPLTIGMGAIGTGLILLGLNAARRLNGIAMKGSTTVIGIIALAWGLLETVFDPPAELSFALMLIVVGVVTIASLLSHTQAEA